VNVAQIGHSGWKALFDEVGGGGGAPPRAPPPPRKKPPPGGVVCGGGGGGGAGGPRPPPHLVEKGFPARMADLRNVHAETNGWNT
jgi:hypothetical protein